MQTILLDGDRYAGSRELHEALKRLLHLPAYYGMNADALYDCLSERAEPVNLWILSWGTEDTHRALTLVSRVVTDLGGTVKELTK